MLHIIRNPAKIMAIKNIMDIISKGKRLTVGFKKKAGRIRKMKGSLPCLSRKRREVPGRNIIP